MFNKNIVKNNTIIYNVFSDEELKIIYSDINLILNDGNFILQNFYGRLYIPLYWRQKTELSDPIGLKINQSIFDSIFNHCIELSDVPLQVESISFARYSLEYGIPRLPPHTDFNFKEPRLTFDVQLDANIKWPILTENKTFLLENNSASVFSGTNEIHWRAKQEFNKNDYLDILLCQLSEKSDNETTIDKNFVEEIKNKQKLLNVKYERGLI
jgi:hypothetical protein